MSTHYRTNFAALCQAIRGGDVAMLECRNVENDHVIVVVCAVNKLTDNMLEFRPLARMLDYAEGSLVLPGPSANGAIVRPELN